MPRLVLCTDRLIIKCTAYDVVLMRVNASECSGAYPWVERSKGGFSQLANVLNDIRNPYV